jgi:putative membrane protein
MGEGVWSGPGYVFRWVILILGIVIIVIVGFALFAFTFIQPTPASHYFYYRPFFFPFGLFFGIFMLLLIVGTLRWIFWPWGWRYERKYWRYHDQSYAILRQRYARGEITKEQFEQMMQDLKAHEQVPGKP